MNMIGLPIIEEDKLIKSKIPKTRIDYIKYYAEELKKDNKHFKQYKMLLDSQYKTSRELFRKQFGEGEEFKKNAREYLRKRGIIK